MREEEATCLQEKESVVERRKWEGEEAIFNCINNQSFLFGHEKALAMGKRRGREGEREGEKGKRGS